MPVIVVEEQKVFAGRLLDPQVAGCRDALIALVDIAHLWILSQDIGGLIGGPIIDGDDFDFGAVGLGQHADKHPFELSAGMRKRAGFARALVLEPDIVLFDEPDSGLDPVRVAYLDELVVTAQKETGATFFIITHNIQSVMRTADYMGILFRSNLVKFASKADMVATENPIIQQFLAGRPEGPIGMDEMADSDGRTFLEGDTASLLHGPLARPGEPAVSARRYGDRR